MAARLILREDFHEGVEGMGAPGSREWLPSTLAAANAAPEVLKLTAAEELAFERRTPEEVAAEVRPPAVCHIVFRFKFSASWVRHSGR